MSKKQRRKKVICPNCKVRLNENVNFCHNCGQENHEKRASVKMLVNDFTQDYFTFDSKLFRSLKPLLFNPGFLTLEFINGKRMNYIKPIRLYLFISFIYFLTNGLLNYSSTKNSSSPSEKHVTTYDLQGNVIFDGTEEELTKEKEEKAEKLKKKIETAKMKGNNTTAFLYELDLKLTDKKHQERLDKTIENNFPVFLFFTIPVLALILLLLFYRKENFYVDYLIFSLHFQSFIFILLFAVDIFEYFLFYHWTISLLTLIIPSVYGVIAAKKTFSTTYLGAFFRLLASSAIHLIISFLLFIAYLIAIVIFL